MRASGAGCLLLLLSTLTGSAAAAPPKPKPAAPLSAEPRLTLTETLRTPGVDYQAEVYAGVALDDAYAKERGLSRGLVLLVFEHQRRPAFRVPREKIRKIVRFSVEDGAPVMLVKAAAPPRAKVDVLETDEGWIAVETVSSSGGIFTTSDVYAFPKGASLEQRVALALGSRTPTRERIARALTIAATSSPK